MASKLPARLIAAIFYNGFRLDLSFSAYLSAIPFFLISLSTFVPVVKIQNIIKWYTIFIVLMVCFLTTIDLELFTAWGFRLDATPLMYLNTPEEMLASVAASPVVLLLALYCLISLFLIAIYLKTVHRVLNQAEETSLKYLPVFLLFTAALIVPIRGGLQLAPLNLSDAYFSRNVFVNQAAINVPWNFFNSISRNAHTKENPYNFMQEKVAKELLEEFFDFRNNKSHTVLNTKRPNVLLIIWESFTAKATASLGEMTGITPHFDSLVREGLLFSNFYATADRSDKGIASILSGYPAQPTQSILKIPNKSAKLPTINHAFEKEGYYTSFYYGGELEFANMKSFLINSSYDKIVGKQDFDAHDWNSKWGAHDHVLLTKVAKDLKQMQQPFFTTIFTLSSHEPFEVPVETVIEGEDEESLFLNSLHYTDGAISDFLERIKKEPWYENTLVIIVADHGHRMPQSSKNHQREKFHIPMLWVGGALAVSDSVIATYSSQADLASTLLNQVDIPANDFFWSRNIFSEGYRPFAQFAFNDGYGFVSDNGYMAFDNHSKLYIIRDSATTAFEMDFRKHTCRFPFRIIWTNRKFFY